LESPSKGQQGIQKKFKNTEKTEIITVSVLLGVSIVSSDCKVEGEKVRR
jgi:hypothetical protein